jgi:hypothetical protein
MSYISIDPAIYRRLAQLARQSGISVHHAASDAIDNWLDITSDPHLAIAALRVIISQRNSRPTPAPPAPLPANVTFINQPRPGAPRANPARTRRAAR